MNTADNRGFSMAELRAEMGGQSGPEPVPPTPPAAAAPDPLRALLEQPTRFSEQQWSIIRDTCCGGATEAEATELRAIAEARGLNPMLGECYFVKRWDSGKRRDVWAVQIAIDAMRAKADATGLYEGQDEPEFERDMAGKPTLARVRVYRRGWSRPAVGVARYDEYVQTTREGTATRFWKQMPHNQLAKCAEALALRKAFPARFARIYTAEEMAQVENDRPPPAPPHDARTGEILDGSHDLIVRHQLALERASDVAELKELGQQIAADAKRGAITREQVEGLRTIAKRRRDQLKTASAAPAPTTATPVASAGPSPDEDDAAEPDQGDPVYE